LVGNKKDLRNDGSTIRDLAKMKQTPVALKNKIIILRSHPKRFLKDVFE